MENENHARLTSGTPKDMMNVSVPQATYQPGGLAFHRWVEQELHQLAQQQNGHHLSPLQPVTTPLQPIPQTESHLQLLHQNNYHIHQLPQSESCLQLLGTSDQSQHFSQARQQEELHRPVSCPTNITELVAVEPTDKHGEVEVGMPNLDHVHCYREQDIVSAAMETPAGYAAYVGNILSQSTPIPDNEFTSTTFFTSNESSEETTSSNSTDRKVIQKGKGSVCGDAIIPSVTEEKLQPINSKRHKGVKTSKSKSVNNRASKTGKKIKCETNRFNLDVGSDDKINKNATASGNTDKDGKLFMCLECPSTFSDSSGLKRHLRIHKQVKPFCCSQCSASFTQSSHLHRHLRGHTKEKPYTCAICGQALAHAHTLKQHMLAAHPDSAPTDAFSCDVCHKRFVTQSALIRHARVHTGEKPFLCGKCTAQFSDTSGLKRHLSVHTVIRPYQCSLCNVTFKRKDNLLKHLKSRHAKQDGTVIYISPEEQLAKGAVEMTLPGLSPDLVQSDLDANVGMDQLLKDGCTPSAGENTNFLHSERKVTDANYIPVCVSDCRSETSSHSQYIEEVQTPPSYSEGHTVLVSSIHDSQDLSLTILTNVNSNINEPSDECEKPVQAPLEPTSNNPHVHCKLNSNLSTQNDKESTEISSPDLPDIISSTVDLPSKSITSADITCRNESSQESLVEPVHIAPIDNPNYSNSIQEIPSKPRTKYSCQKVQTGKSVGIKAKDNKKQQCSVCKKMFFDLSTLKRHKRIHSGERPYRCAMCSAQFTQSGHLNAHVNFYHLVKEIKSCPVCKRKFNYPLSLRRHMLIHKDKQLFSCPTCGGKFQQKYGLIRHMRSHQRDLPHSCSICNTGFTDLASLKRHRKSHSEDRPFGCSQCPSSFKAFYNLQRHMHVHVRSGFKCMECGAKFANSPLQNKGKLDGKAVRLSPRWCKCGALFSISRTSNKLNDS